MALPGFSLQQISQDFAPCVLSVTTCPWHFPSNKTRTSAMVDELEQFQQDLLESVRQMKAGEAARVTQMPLSAAEEQSVEASSTLGLGNQVAIDSAGSVS
jgi:hypothetical protein